MNSVAEDSSPITLDRLKRAVDNLRTRAEESEGIHKDLNAEIHSANRKIRRMERAVMGDGVDDCGIAGDVRSGARDIRTMKRTQRLFGGFILTIGIPFAIWFVNNQIKLQSVESAMQLQEIRNLVDEVRKMRVAEGE